MTRKKKKIMIKIISIIAIIIGIFFALANHFEANVKPIVMRYCKAKIETLTVNAVNHAISMVINDGIDYGDLIDVEKDKDGNITALKAKASKVNLLARQISSIALLNVEKISKKGLDVPLGAFFGSVIFAGSGPDVTVKFVSTGAVDCVFTSEFSEASINHTLHKIYIKVVSGVRLIIPSSDAYVETSSEVLVSECVLVGKVPDTYLNSADIGDMIDLIP